MAIFGSLLIALGAIALATAATAAVFARFFARASAEFEALLDGPYPGFTSAAVECDDADSAEERDRRLAGVIKFGECPEQPARRAA